MYKQAYMSCKHTRILRVLHLFSVSTPRSKTAPSFSKLFIPSIGTRNVEHAFQHLLFIIPFIINFIGDPRASSQPAQSHDRELDPLVYDGLIKFTSILSTDKLAHRLFPTTSALLSFFLQQNKRRNNFLKLLAIVEHFETKNREKSSWKEKNFRNIEIARSRMIFKQQKRQSH